MKINLHSFAVSIYNAANALGYKTWHVAMKIKLYKVL